MHLHTPLGDWYTTGEASQKWRTYKDQADNLYMAPQGSQTAWTKHTLVWSNKRDCLIYNKTGVPDNPPKTGTRISLRLQSERTWIFSNSTAKEVNIRQPMHWQEEPDREAMARRLGEDARFTGDLNDLGEALRNGTLQGASDGSIKNKEGTSAWVLEPDHLTRATSHMRGAGPVDGDHETMNSTRAERSSIPSPIHAVTLLAKRYNIRHGGVTMHIDNTSSFLQGDPPKPGEGALRHHCGDYNLEQMKKELSDKLDRRNITVTFKHVKSHQDDKANRKKDKQGNLIPLTQPTLLNIDCDARAEEQYAEPNISQARVMPHSSVKISFGSANIINIGKLLQQIVMDRHGPKMKKYIMKKFKRSTDQFDSVDWISAQAAFKRKTFNQKTRIFKAIYNWLLTMARLHKITPAEYPSPLCNT